MNYNDYNDYELLFYIQENSEEANEILYKKYKTLIIKEASSIYKRNAYIGLEFSDLVQEGMIGLNHAVEEYKDQEGTLFYTYALSCIRNTLKSYIISLERQKHKILNEAYSIESVFLDSIKENEIFLKDLKTNPESLVIYQEKERKLYKYALTNLTAFEFQVFQLQFQHIKPKEIEQILKKDHKSINNTIQRIRSKFKKAGFLSLEC